MRTGPITKISRREFVRMCSLSAAAFVVGCAANPVTGKSQLMLVSERDEINVDRMHSPHQFSADYGISQDKSLDGYMAEVGNKMTRITHRPQMPYNFHVVNANYVNAYAFPGGSIACTRGILLSLDNEAELAALLGHELGHVNARHTAEIMSKSKISSAIVGGLAIAAGAYDKRAGGIAAQLGMLGSGALLASYSRDNERQADDLGMRYMVASGYNPEGMVGLMDMLQNMSKHKMSTADLLFSTHPMSDERYKTAVSTARSKYTGSKSNPLNKERYMDRTSGLRKIRGAVTALQKGETLLAKNKVEDADAEFSKALAIAPNDYAGLVMMAKSRFVQKKYADADRYIQKAKQVYPGEAQAYHISGFVNLKRKNYQTAFNDFSTYEKKLAGNPNILFFKGLSLEGLERIDPAAKHYHKFLQIVNQGDQAQYAYKRLKEWGYIK
ncbi:MAG: M48 family metalloprotease [Desulfobacteraceae bacterium]|nr:M48 family metalloprotease [Desulfobacteraceae bacterium]